MFKWRGFMFLQQAVSLLYGICMMQRHVKVETVKKYLPERENSCIVMNRE